MPRLQSEVLADTLSSAEYFSAKVNNNVYSNGQTVFLNNGQTLQINFGKPVGDPFEETENIYISQEEIGNYVLEYLSGSFNLTINGTLINNDDYINQGKFEINTFVYSPDYEEDEESGEEYQYFSMSINLADTAYFPSGEYIISFNDYIEHSGADYAGTLPNSFEATFYVFKTIDYFSSESATTTNTDMQNIRTVSKLGTTYKNYFYFNYTNYATVSSTNNYLPSLSFNADKFIIEISKTYQGVTYTCSVSKFATNYVVLGSNTPAEFLTVTYNSENNKLTIFFKDLGEYSINYKFIYTKSDGNYVNLTNANIATFKQDILHIFGYQMYYFDTNDQQKNEFKYVENGITNVSTSADVSYMLAYESLTNKETALLAGDENILSALSGKTAVSSNQPVISVQYNSSLLISSSYYYVWDSQTNDWKKEEDVYKKTTYSNNSFADAGKYLLKVVYNYDKNYNLNGIIAPDVYFTQYFYFTITNTVASFSIKEQVTDETTGQVTENVLGTNSYTQNPVKVVLSGQSIFNSDVRVVIASKNYALSTYTAVATLNGSVIEQIYDVSNNLNYKATLYYGNNKTQVSYFTIDNTAFQNIQILTVKKSVSASNYYVKGSQISFFTNQAVTLQWTEKLSGASSTAYFKYIPFASTGYVQPNSNQFIYDQALPTNYSLDFNVTDNPASARYFNSKSMSLITDKYVFSQQGFYIVYLCDEAGNWQYIPFCIDNTDITIWQYSNDTYQAIQKYNVVSADTTLQWGQYKLINLNLNINQIDDIADEWIKYVIKSKLENVNDNDIFESSFYNGQLYFAPEINSVMFLQEGATYVKLTNQTSYDINLVQQIENTTLAIEMTYVFHFIDESNPYFNSAGTLSSADYANYASKNYSITTSSDASKADIVFNSSGTSSLDYSNINYNSVNLSQAGFTDSYSYNSTFETYSDNIDTRSKYYYATGTTASGNISLLSYIFVADPSSSITVQKVAIYYYSFITANGQYRVSDTAVETVIFDRINNIDLTTQLASGDFAGFQAYNINAEFNLSTSLYQTKEGKYVIVRIYSEDSTVNEYDYLVRESSFVVDRQKIVSSPSLVGDEFISIIGQFIHVNVLNGDVNMVKFDDIYMAYYNDTYILETNKLPVVSYIPISKYGSGSDTQFNFYDVMQYFYTMTSDTENYYLKRYQTASTDEKSILGLSYFGRNTLATENFDYPTNLSKINNTSFDLTVKIEFASDINAERSVIYTGVNSTNGYFTSGNFINEGYYFVTLTQNYANGTTYPNVSNNFSFMFYISRSAPQFDFLDSNDEILNNINNSSYNVSYTNADTVKVSWTDPSSDYMAKINMNDNGNGRTAGIYYYTSADSTRRYIPVSDISTNDKNHYFMLNIAGFANSTVVYVYMEYEGTVRNSSSNVAKALFIDRQAPTQVLNTLIASPEINGISVGSYSRVYVDENNVPTTTGRKYNVPTTTGAMAYYTFAVELTAQNLLSLFNIQAPVGNYYTEGYYYYGIEIGSSGNMFVTNVSSAKNAFATHTISFIVSSLSAGRIYEIIEQDLAGNITIYSIYFVTPNANETVLEFNKPETEHNTQSNIKYSELLETQNIFAKSNFEMTDINLHTYQWLVISVNGTTYLTTPFVNNNSYYDITHWSDTSTLPNIYALDEILSFESSRNVQRFVLVEPIKNYNYTFNISVTSVTTDILTYTTLSSSQEGILINGVAYTNGISVYLTSIQIYSWQNLSYTKIYDLTTTFSSNNHITFTSSANAWTFAIAQPITAYKYVFVDNYGVSYVFYHTFGEPAIEDRIVGDVANISIPNEDGIGSSLWYVGYNNISYYYSVVDYYIYIKVQYLSYNTDARIYSWQTFDPSGATNEYGTLLTSGMSSIYYSCSTVAGKPTINRITLIAQSSTLNLDAFNGSAVKFTITLVNVNENPSVALDLSNVSQENILVNNLNPKVELFDKNNENKTSLFEGNTLFSGQLTIRFGSISYSNEAIFSYRITLQFNGGSEFPINSGIISNTPGYYTIKTYITIDGVNYLYETQGFIISESSTDFFKVVVFNSQTGIWEPKSSTGKEFEYEGKYYSSHYLVNTENYRISTNEEQDIDVDNFSFVNNGGIITRFYKISNYLSTSTSINYYEKTIAITYIHTDNLTNLFYYISANGQQIELDNVSTQIVITTANQNLANLMIVYNSYCGLKENKIDIKVYFGENQILYNPIKTVLSNNTNAITLTEAGVYTIYFSDQANNNHKFVDQRYGNTSSSYQITYINGVMYQINGEQPIENGIYNDKVEITLPANMNLLYDAGGKPVITVMRNGIDYTSSVTLTNGIYALNRPGYYQVYFSAIIDTQEVREQSYSFTILDSTESRWAFEFSEFANYEITSIKKNGTPIDLTNYFKYNSYQVKVDGVTTTVKYLKNIFISLYDEITGAGAYEITIRTNIGIANQAFTFNFVIRDTSNVPIVISVAEGTTTSSIISVSFNALNLYNKVGSCTVLAGTSSYEINSEANNQTVTLDLERNGVNFIQIVTSSGKVLYSYKVIKEEPLNAISIIVIIISALAVSGLVVTVVLLRRRMKIR
ncbi:MAG: hypothetical protein PHR96_01695 [Clostridia bacterium]|nr:hypothetical protein [Clostridia bacterium]